MEIKPLPCPWCGVVPGVHKTLHGGVYLECTNYACPVQPQSQVFSTMEKLTRKWNERVKDGSSN